MGLNDFSVKNIFYRIDTPKGAVNVLPLPLDLVEYDKADNIKEAELIAKAYEVKPLDIKSFTSIVSKSKGFIKYSFVAKNYEQVDSLEDGLILIPEFEKYLLGELGYFSVLGIIAFYLLIRKTKITLQIQTIFILLILGSVFYLWEVVCRSNIFLNGTLVLITIVYFLNLKTLSLKNIGISGILIGLIISTRNVFVIPFIIAFIYSLKNNKINFIQIGVLGLISLLTFVLTFLPFVWNHFEDFKVMNPFIVQSTFLVPFHYTLLFICMSVIVGFLCENTSDVYFYSGLILFASIAIYFIYHFVKIGFHESFFGSVADISYFILCIPFFLFHLITETNREITN